MASPDDLLYEYAVIRYVPRVDREEFINIGLIMMNKRHKWLRGKIRIDESRIKALYPGADSEILKKQCGLFERKDVPAESLPVEEKYRWLAAVKSASIQVSPSHPGLLTEGSPESLTHACILERMEDEFSRLFYALVL